MGSYGDTPVSGVVYGYIATVSQGVLAALYVVLLTRIVGLSDYGYYNALLSIIGIVGLFFPTFNIDHAIAREAAMLRSRGAGVENHYSALVLLSLVVSSAYTAAVIAMIPVYIAHRIPEGYVGIAYIYSLYIFLQGFSAAFSNYLWALGRLKAQALGILVGSLVFRASEVALILVLRSVYAIVASMAIGQALSLAFYLYTLRRLPNPLPGLGVLRRGFRSYFKLGFQSWIISYLGSINATITTYIIYNTLGPEYVAIYSIAQYILGGVTALISAATNVFGSRMAYAMGSSPVTSLDSMVRDYSVASASLAGILAQLGIAALPALPLLGIVYGEYSRSIPLAVALMGPTVLGAPLSIYTTYYWVSGLGWVPVRLSVLGVAVNLALVASLTHAVGIASVVVSSYAVNTLLLAVYTAIARGRGYAATTSAIYSILAAASGSSYLYGLPWPLAQALTLLASIAIAAYMKPIPSSAAEQLPKILRPFIKYFSS